MSAEKIKKTKQIATKKQALIAAVKTENPEMNLEQIAECCDTSVSYVHEVLQRFNLIKKNIDDFKEYQAEILLGIKAKIIESITEDDYKKASLQQKLTSMGIVHDKEQELRGNDKTTMPLVVINRIQLGKVEQPDCNVRRGSVIDV